MPIGVYKHPPQCGFQKGHTINFGRKFSEEHKIRIGEANKGKLPWSTGKHLPKKIREKISLKHLGKKLSEETRKRISIALKGKPSWNKGKKISPEHRANLSKAQKRRFKTIKGTFYEKHHSQESRIKMSKARKGRFQGKNHPNWKGGQIKRNGYVYIFNSLHPRANKQGYAKRANLIMEMNISRHLTSEEVVHHINEIKTDDRIENLKLFKNNSEHQKFHFMKKNKSLLNPKQI